MSLESQTCEACSADAPKVTEQERDEFLKSIPEWNVVDADGVAQLDRTFKFKDFAAALAFVNRVGDIAEQENHHPTITFTWGQANVRWWTHKINGLHRNDFIMAARTDQCQ